MSRSECPIRTPSGWTHERPASMRGRRPPEGPAPSPRPGRRRGLGRLPRGASPGLQTPPRLSAAPDGLRRWRASGLGSGVRRRSRLRLPQALGLTVTGAALLAVGGPGSPATRPRTWAATQEGSWTMAKKGGRKIGRNARYGDVHLRQGRAASAGHDRGGDDPPQQRREVALTDRDGASHTCPVPVPRP
jgi:hypothetical protein